MEALCLVKGMPGLRRGFLHKSFLYLKSQEFQMPEKSHGRWGSSACPHHLSPWLTIFLPSLHPGLSRGYRDTVSLPPALGQPSMGDHKPCGATLTIPESSYSIDLSTGTWKCLDRMRGRMWEILVNVERYRRDPD